MEVFTIYKESELMDLQPAKNASVLGGCPCPMRRSIVNPSYVERLDDYDFLSFSECCLLMPLCVVSGCSDDCSHPSVMAAELGLFPEYEENGELILDFISGCQNVLVCTRERILLRHKRTGSERVVDCLRDFLSDPERGCRAL